MPVPKEKRSRFPMLLAVILIIILFNSVRSIIDLNKSIKKVDESKMELVALEEKNKDLKQKITYVQTPEYLEKAAIEKLNKTKPGDKIVILNEKTPEQVNPTQQDLPEPIPVTWKLWLRTFHFD